MVRDEVVERTVEWRGKQRVSRGEKRCHSPHRCGRNAGLTWKASGPLSTWAACARRTEVLWDGRVIGAQRAVEIAVERVARVEHDGRVQLGAHLLARLALPPRRGRRMGQGEAGRVVVVVLVLRAQRSIPPSRSAPPAPSRAPGRAAGSGQWPSCRTPRPPRPATSAAAARRASSRAGCPSASASCPRSPFAARSRAGAPSPRASRSRRSPAARCGPSALG